MSGEGFVTIIVLSYYSEATISRSLHSILTQDYQRIKIVIADDGSVDFSSKYIDDIIQGYPSFQNRYRILGSSENRGTVKNLRAALEYVDTDYFMIIGADDFLVSSDAISGLIRTFSLRGQSSLLVTGYSKMVSKDGSTVRTLLPNGDGLGAILSGDPLKMFNHLSYECCIPIVATCFKREFLTAVPSAFSEKYKYYEDYPTFLNMTRIGVVPAFYSEVVTCHPAGGIANPTLVDSPLSRGLHSDRVQMWDEEVEPYISQLSPQAKKKYKLRRKKEIKQWEELHKARPKKNSRSSSFKKTVHGLISHGIMHHCWMSFVLASLLFSLASFSLPIQLGTSPMPFLSIALSIVGGGMLATALIFVFLGFEKARKKRLVKKSSERN